MVTVWESAQMHIFRCAVIVGLRATVEIRLIFFYLRCRVLGHDFLCRSDVGVDAWLLHRYFHVHLGIRWGFLPFAIANFDDFVVHAWQILRRSNNSDQSPVLAKRCYLSIPLFFHCFFFLCVCVSGERVCVYVCRTRAVIKSSRISGTFFLFALHALRWLHARLWFRFNLIARCLANWLVILKFIISNSQTTRNRRKKACDANS